MHDSRDEEEDAVIEHHESTDGETEALCEGNGKNFHPVQRTAQMNGHTGPDAGEQATENGAEHQIGTGDGGGGCDVKKRLNEERGAGIDTDGIDGGQHKTASEATVAEEKKGEVEYKQQRPERKREQRIKEDGSTGESTVEQTDGREKDSDADGIDKAGCRKQ